MLSHGMIRCLANSIGPCEDENSCESPGLFSCHHCSKQVCLRHLLQHNAINLEHANSLYENLNNVLKFLQIFSVQNTAVEARNRLDDWRKQMFETIELIHASCLTEINTSEEILANRFSNFKEPIMAKAYSLQERLLNLKNTGQISQQDLVPLTHSVSKLEQICKSFLCGIDVQINSIPFQNLVHVHNAFSYERTVVCDTQIKSYKTIPVKDMKAFTTNPKGDSILWLDDQQQLHCINKAFQSRTLKLPDTLLMSPVLASAEMKLNRNCIVDTKYCACTETYLILLPQALFSFNDRTDQFKRISITRYKDYPFRSISCFNSTSLYILYCAPGGCIELGKFSHENDNVNIHIDENTKRWECLTNDKTEWISQMDQNESGQIGLLVCRQSALYRRFELRNENLDFLRVVQLENDFIERFFPCQYQQWFMKSLSENYYVYSNGSAPIELLKVHFPIGIQEFSNNTLVLGIDQQTLLLCDAS